MYLYRFDALQSVVGRFYTIMADGKTHAVESRKTANRVSWIGGLAALISPLSIGFVIGVWLGHIVSPDLDHHFTTYDEWRIRRYNRLAGLLWSIYWWPYQKTHSHRGRSHRWPIGTIERMIYLLWLPIGASLYQWPGQALPLFIFWLAVFTGWSIADDTHLRLDNL